MTEIARNMCSYLSNNSVDVYIVVIYIYEESASSLNDNIYIRYFSNMM